MADHRSSAPFPRRRRLGGYAAAGVAVIAATAVSWPLHAVLAPANLTMFYLVAVVVIAARYGRRPSLFASLAAVAAFDFFFVPPYFTFAVAEAQYVVTFGAMLLVAVVIGGLTARIRRQAEEAGQRERHTAALYALSRELAQAKTVDQLLACGARHLSAVFDGPVAVFLPDRSGRLGVAVTEGGFDASSDEIETSREVFDQRRPAGPGVGGRPRTDALFVPMLGPRGALGVVAVRPRSRRAVATAEARRQLETFVNHMALALERARLDSEAEASRVRAESERLRNALLTSISHDLRTPLASITGAATTILESGRRLGRRTEEELLESVRDEAERLNRLVGNLLQMTRLESGQLELRRDWHSLEEVVGAALRRLGQALGDRKVVVTVPADLPLVPIDDVLIEQVVVNLLDNTLKHTPADSPIRIMATAGDRAVTVEVADHGPGLPRGEEDRVFEKFYQAVRDGRRGAGLGLAICRGVIEAHGGRIWAQNLPEGGVAFLFTLPWPDAAPPKAPIDA